MHAPRKKHWVERILRSRYFLYALLLHVIFFLIFGGQVIFKALVRTENFDSSTLVAGDSNDTVPPPPPAATQDTDSKEPTVQVAASAAPTEILATDIPTPDSFSMQVSSIISPNADVKNTPNMAKTTPNNSESLQGRLQGIKGFVDSWGTGGKGGVQGKGRSTQAEFTCYVAKYADGDWDTSNYVRGNSIFGGSIPFLLLQINEWSHGRIKANLVPQPLNLASREIFDKKPPFIFFNGHKDFHLTDQEVENLRRYLLLGGAIWGDNGLPGVGSRFDVAFRREMKRVIPDQDKPFEPLPATHSIFTEGFFPLNGPPPGMNYVQEDIEVIKIDGDIAVIYTPNDYADLMRVRFVEGTTEPDFKGGPNKAATDIIMWRQGDAYYRNLTSEGAESAFKLGINIVVHLLTRFQDKAQMAL